MWKVDENLMINLGLLLIYQQDASSLHVGNLLSYAKFHHNTDLFVTRAFLL